MFWYKFYCIKVLYFLKVLHSAPFRRISESIGVDPRLNSNSFEAKVNVALLDIAILCFFL